MKKINIILATLAVAMILSACTGTTEESTDSSDVVETQESSSEDVAESSSVDKTQEPSSEAVSGEPSGSEGLEVSSEANATTDSTATPGKYATVEEWYISNPSFETIVNMGLSAEDTNNELNFTIVENSIVYSVILEEKMFGEDNELNQAYTEFFDASFESEKEQYVSIIPELAELSGVPESSISVRIEIYNPDESTPSYTKTFVQE